jgi:hypothetical protein
VAAPGCVDGRRVRATNAQNCRTQSTDGQRDGVPHHRDAHQSTHQVCWILRDQPRDDEQVRVERHVNSVRVRQVHSLGHVGLPLAPTLLLVDDDNDCSDHFESLG